MVQSNPDKVMPEWEEMAATSCAAQNMMLMGTAMNIIGEPTHHLSRPHPATGPFLPDGILAILYAVLRISELVVVNRVMMLLHQSWMTWQSQA